MKQAFAQVPFWSNEDCAMPPLPVFSRRYNAVTMAAYSPVALGWSPMPGTERTGSVVSLARTMSISPVRAQ